MARAAPPVPGVSEEPVWCGVAWARWRPGSFLGPGRDGVVSEGGRDMPARVMCLGARQGGGSPCVTVSASVDLKAAGAHLAATHTVAILRWPYEGVV